MHPGRRCCRTWLWPLGAGAHLHVVEVRRADELDTAFAALPPAGADALLVLDDSLVLSSRLGGRLQTSPPRVGSPRCMRWRERVAAGGLMARVCGDFARILWVKNCLKMYRE